MTTINKEEFSNWLRNIISKFDYDYEVKKFSRVSLADLVPFFTAGISADDFAEYFPNNTIVMDGHITNVLLHNNQFGIRNNLDYISRLPNLLGVTFIKNNPPTKNNLDKLRNSNSIKGVYVVSEDLYNDFDTFDELLTHINMDENADYDYIIF